jgi:hypothetical protein
MSDTPEHPTEYKPEEGAEVRPAPRYAARPVSPGGLETLARETGDETPYRSVSLLAIGAFTVAVAYSVFVVVGGLTAFWDSARAALIVGTALVPLLSVPVAMKFGVRGWPGLLRVAGLALAVFYAVPVGIGGLVAFSNRAAWLMPLWTLLVPLLAAGAGWAARLRIQASEDTLSGKDLATWAIGLSLFFALCYTAYFTATYFAVCLGAEKFAEEWIRTLEKDDALNGFLLTRPPEYRPVGNEAEKRLRVELLPAEEEGGGFSGFGQRPYVRLLRNSSPERVELVAVRNWGQERGGYKVEMTYRVTTPYWSFPLEVAVQSAEAPKRDPKERQKDSADRRWYVRSELTYAGDVKPTTKGKRLHELAAGGYTFAEAWAMKLARVDQNQMFPALDAARPAGRQAVVAAVGPGVRAADLRDPFFKGDLVKSDPKEFWAPKDIREAVVGQVKQMFAAQGPERNAPTLRVKDQRQLRWPLWSEDKESGRLFFYYEAAAGLTVNSREPLPEGGERPVTVPVTVEALIVVSCEATALELEPGGKMPQWRIERVDLVRARRADQGVPPGLGRPGPGGGPQ